MTSCEPQHCSAYAEDLRWRVVWQIEGLQCTQEQVARNLNIDQSTVSRIIQLFHTTGNVYKKIKSADSAFKMLTSPAQLFILTCVIEKPGIYLWEIQEELQNALLIEVHEICRFLHASGFTHKKLHCSEMNSVANNL